MTDGNFNNYCEVLLARYNRRNTKAITRHLESLCGFLRQKGNHVVQTMFGGSVQKGTYVTGLSDVDVLLIVNQSSLVSQSPASVVKFLRDTIQQRLPMNPVRAGKLAVTVSYADGNEIQILPAIRRNAGGVRIADSESTTWSKVVRPDDFARKLAEVNKARKGRAVPVIKLAKAMADCFITRKSRKITGYHVESLAIDAFRNYSGPLDPKSMLMGLLSHSIHAVMRPITDSTGQSRYVDEYLGPAGSSHRKRASTYFGQMRAKVNSCRTRAEFGDMFCEGN